MGARAAAARAAAARVVESVAERAAAARAAAMAAATAAATAAAAWAAARAAAARAAATVRVAEKVAAVKVAARAAAVRVAAAKVVERAAAVRVVERVAAVRPAAARVVERAAARARWRGWCGACTCAPKNQAWPGNDRRATSDVSSLQAAGDPLCFLTRPHPSGVASVTFRSSRHISVRLVRLARNTCTCSCCHVWCCCLMWQSLCSHPPRSATRAHTPHSAPLLIPLLRCAEAAGVHH